MCVAKNIEGCFKMCTLFLVYRKIWLNLPRADCRLLLHLPMDGYYFDYQQKFLKEITGVNMVLTLSFVFMVYSKVCSGMSSLCACFLMCNFVNFDIGGRRSSTTWHHLWWDGNSRLSWFCISTKLSQHRVVLWKFCVLEPWQRIIIFIIIWFWSLLKSLKDSI